MNVLIITQDDPFYIGKSLNYLFDKSPSELNYVGCVLLSSSPYGKTNKTFYQRAFEAYKVFGLSFFLGYSLRFILNKFNKKTNVTNVLKSNKIPIIEINKSINSKDSLDLISSYKPDVIVSIAGNQIFKKDLINLPKMGCLNLHTALLPKYRGLMPTFWVLKNDEKKTGVSVFFIDEGIDSGEIISQQEVIIGNHSQSSLIKETKIIGMKLIINSLLKIKSGNFAIIENPESEATYYSFPSREDVNIFYQKGKRFF